MGNHLQGVLDQAAGQRTVAGKVDSRHIEDGITDRGQMTSTWMTPAQTRNRRDKQYGQKKNGGLQVSAEIIVKS